MTTTTVQGFKFNPDGSIYIPKINADKLPKRVVIKKDKAIVKRKVKSRYKLKSDSKTRIWFKDEWIHYSCRKGGMSKLPGLEEEFTRLWNSNLMKKDIAAHFRISIPSVKRLARHFSLISKYSKDHPFNERIIKEAPKLYRSGMSTMQIGKHFGVSEEKARKFLHLAGTNLRQAGNGMSRHKMTRQNNIIKEMYESGTPLKEIERAAGIGKHGIDKRLAFMKIARARNPKKVIGKRYDAEIRRLFLDGLNLNEIAKETGIPYAVVRYRFQHHSFRDYRFKIKFQSQLTGRWKTSTKTYRTPREIMSAKKRLLKFSKPLDIKVAAIRKRKRKWNLIDKK